MANLFVGNTNLLELFRLRSAIDLSYVNDANVSVTLTDELGVEVTGQTWPTALTYIPGSNGDYRGIISESVDFTPDEAYYAIIEADGGVNRFGRWEVPFVPRIRRM